jgi:CubicO group peptidase (beta-lactamase class C family)
VLGLVLAAATRRTVSEYASAKLWHALGSEADASWIIDAQGQEITFAYVSAVLRDWARLGLMLANNGSRSGRSVVPRDWLMGFERERHRDRLRALEIWLPSVAVCGSEEIFPAGLIRTGGPR